MNPLPDPVAALQSAIDTIPLARVMGATITAAGGDTLAMQAPLAPNINDKGCVFGGSLASVMTLAGWALLELELRQHGIHCDVFVADSQIAYLAPVWTDFCAEARLEDDAGWDPFFTALASRGKARIAVQCRVHANDSGQTAATLRARFVAKRSQGTGR